MQSRFTSTALALLVGVACTAAHAQSSSRDPVRQELADAMRDGTLMRGEVDARGAMPGAAMQSRSRADVLAELAAAQRSGEMLAAGDAEQTSPELDAARHAPPTMLAGKTRAQVRAEFADARRNGEVMAAGESSLTPRELHPMLYHRAAVPMVAGVRAGSAMDTIRTMQ
jgi:hypothetical protein